MQPFRCQGIRSAWLLVEQPYGIGLTSILFMICTGAPMNFNPGHSNEFIRSLAAFCRELSGLVGTLIFWLLMIALLSCPAWLPGIIENMTGH